MKESTFIELLNLYVDQEISKEDAAHLEQEIATNPERRKVYLQYCRMHRASVILGETFSSTTDASVSKLAQATRSVEQKMAHQSEDPGFGLSLNWLSVGGFVAAAACVAFVVMHQQPVAQPVQMSALAASTQTPSLMTVGPQVKTIQASVVDLPLSPSMLAEQKPARTQLASRRLRAVDPQDESLASISVPAASYAWMNGVRMPSVKAGASQDLSFDRQQVDETQNMRRFQGPRSMPDRVEMTAFQFQK